MCIRDRSAFPACAAFKKHLQFYRHCLMDFTGHPEMGLERNDESVSKALAHIEQLTRDRLLKPVVDRVFEFDQVVEAHRYMETLSLIHIYRQRQAPALVLGGQHEEGQ